MKLDDIDFAALYREHMHLHRVQPKPAKAWDTRATQYSANRRQSSYVEDFLARMDLRGASTLLDVGSGPATLALPLARRLGHVVALDYSEKMLAELALKAQAQGVGNVLTLHRAWEDDWRDVPVCDIAIASRSTAVDDVGLMLEKLNAHAGMRVYLTYLVGGHFIDPALRRLMDCPPPAMPDHLHLLGVLHQMGIHPKVDYLETPSRLAGCVDAEEFLQRIEWSSGVLDGVSRHRIAAWFDADPERAAAGGAPMKWAFIAWENVGKRRRDEGLWAEGAGHTQQVSDPSAIPLAPD